MTAPSIPVLARHKLSLIAILVISLAVWLVVLSSWSGVLHAIGKLRTGASGFGTVNIFMLGAAIGWCTLVFLVLKVEFDLPRNFRSVIKFVAGIAGNTAVVSAVAVAGDTWLAQVPALSIALTLVFFGFAAVIGETSFLSNRSMSLTSRITGSCLLGVWGLTSIMVLGLLCFPRVAIRLSL